MRYEQPKSESDVDLLGSAHRHKLHLQGIARSLVSILESFPSPNGRCCPAQEMHSALRAISESESQSLAVSNLDDIAPVLVVPLFYFYEQFLNSRQQSAMILDFAGTWNSS